MSNHIRLRDRKRGGSRYQNLPRGRKTRPKTFKTEEAANSWAKTNKIEKFTLLNLKSDSSSVKKIRIVIEQN